MVKIDSLSQGIKDVSEIGLENAKLAPQMRNWCKHLVVELSARGMIAPMQGLHNYVSLTCPHAAFPAQWMRISGVAEQFIENNCQHCTFHVARQVPNYGQVVLVGILQRCDRLQEQERQQALLAGQISKEIDSLVMAGAKYAEPTQLSILRLIKQLSNSEQRSETASKLLAAAKLNPDFFSDAALEILLILFSDEAAGAYCIDAAVEVIKGKPQFLAKAFAIAQAQLSVSPHFDNLSRILGLFVDPNNFAEHSAVISSLIDRLWYKRDIGEPFLPERNYQNSEALLTALGRLVPETLRALLLQQISINDKNKRININLLLQRLIKDLPDLVTGLMPELLQSLELMDDEYEQSADQLTLDTLKSIIRRKPEELDKVNLGQSKFTAEVRALLVRLNIGLLEDRDFTDGQPTRTDTLVNELLDCVLNKQTPELIRKEATHQLSFLVRERPELFQRVFDSFLGGLSDLAKDEALFNFYENELKTKPCESWTTFNYLIGKDYWEVENVRQGMISRYHDLKRMLVALCNAEPKHNLPKVYSLISKLDSAGDEKLKLNLLAIVSKYTKDPLTVSSFVPQLYTLLLDPVSVEIRYDAIKYLDKLVDHNPMLLTSTLWDLFNLFLRDTHAGIRGLALRMLGNIAREMPERITLEHLKAHREAMTNAKVFVHTTAFAIAGDLRPFMDKHQRYQMTGLLLTLAEIYQKEEDQTSFDTLIDQLIIFAEGNETFMFNVARLFLLPERKDENYDEMISRIKTLSQLVPLYANIGPLWLRTVLGFLRRYPQDHSSQNERSEFYCQMHRLPQKVILQEADLFRNLLMAPRTATDAHFDVAHSLGVLGYFECYAFIREVIPGLDIQYPGVAENRWIRRNIDFWRFVAAGELAVDASEKLNQFNAAGNVFKS